eukprot:15477505-Alexandrium_andersonii.AAC.1
MSHEPLCTSTLAIGLRPTSCSVLRSQGAATPLDPLPIFTSGVSPPPDPADWHLRRALGADRM